MRTGNARSARSAKHMIGGLIEDVVDTSSSDRSFSRTYGHLHTFYVAGEIEGPKNYVQMFDDIRNAGSSDIVQIVINSGGGDLLTAMQMRQSIFNCQAHVQTIVEGMCASAATMIFLAGDELLIEPHAMFMVHNYSGGCFGKGHEMAQQISFEEKWASAFMHDVYKECMTKAEITSMLGGRDFWMTGQQVIDRLLAIQKKKESKSAASKKKSTGTDTPV